MVRLAVREMTPSYCAAAGAPMTGRSAGSFATPSHVAPTKSARSTCEMGTRISVMGWTAIHRKHRGLLFFPGCHETFSRVPPPPEWGERKATERATKAADVVR